MAFHTFRNMQTFRRLGIEIGIAEFPQLPMQDRRTEFLIISGVIICDLVAQTITLGSEAIRSGGCVYFHVLSKPIERSGSYG
jgi:hypothetical protein